MTKQILIVGRARPAGCAAERADAIGVRAYSLTADPVDETEVVRRARDRGVDGILAVSDDAVTAVAGAAFALGLPSVGAAAALRTRDRLALREALTAAGVGGLASRAAASLVEAEVVGRELGVPLVLKPYELRVFRQVTSPAR